VHARSGRFARAQRVAVQLHYAPGNRHPTKCLPSIGAGRKPQCDRMCNPACAIR
jgi:hypothetical protein